MSSAYAHARHLHCLLAADRAQSDELRDHFVKRAMHWLNLAKQFERSLALTDDFAVISDRSLAAVRAPAAERPVALPPVGKEGRAMEHPDFLGCAVEFASSAADPLISARHRDVLLGMARCALRTDLAPRPHSEMLERMSRELPME